MRGAGANGVLEHDDKLRRMVRAFETELRSVQPVADLIKHDLIDEYRLMVFPIVLGPGKRLFEDPIDGIALQLVDMQPAGETLVLTYTPAAA
jgi:dihydrofolate reductase